MYRSHRLDEGWRQVQAGLTLMLWSTLASWDSDSLLLVAANETDFESSEGHQTVHPEIGRLICWLAFSTGAEYLVKGMCFVKGLDLAKDTQVVRVPSWGEDLATWVRCVNANDPSSREKDVQFGTLGRLPLGAALKGLPERDLVLAAVKLLASTIRNRDAHRYTKNVRAFHFHVLAKVLVPAFNAILASIDQTELRARMMGAAGHRTAP